MTNAVELSLQANTSDGLTRGYPAVISLGGNVIMEDWRPAEAAIEARTLRATSDVDGPQIHGRVRSLVQEDILLLVPDTTAIQQASRLLNAINAGAASGWLRAQMVDSTQIWRSPLRGGSLQLAGESLRFEGGKRRYHVRVIREPWFEDAGTATGLGTHNLRSRTAITLTGPDKGTLAAPLILTLAGTPPSEVRVHLFQDRAAPATWTPSYEMSATSTATVDGHTQIRFANGRPTGKNLGRAHVYQAILAPVGATNADMVRTRRDTDGLSASYGAALNSLEANGEIGVLGRLNGLASVFTELGFAALDEDDDYFAVTSYAGRISGTSWRLISAPADGGFAEAVSGPGLLASDPLYLAPGERCVLLPLIETTGSAGAEYDGTALSLQAAVRPRVSEVI